jgi:hypothetical protein
LKVRDAGAERDQRPPAAVNLDFQQVARAVILDRDDDPDRLTVAIDRGKAEQVDVIIFALVERGQRVAVDLDQGPAQRFGRAAVGNPFEAGNRGLAFADREQPSRYAA